MVRSLLVAFALTALVVGPVPASASAAPAVKAVAQCAATRKAPAHRWRALPPRSCYRAR